MFLVIAIVLIVVTMLVATRMVLDGCWNVLGGYYDVVR